MTLLEDVFKVSGVPTHTFVPPSTYSQLKVAIRTPGRCVVIEGPSGIGKTTSVTRILGELGLSDGFTFLSARRPVDVEYIEKLPDLGKVGVVIIDDFHRLKDNTKGLISDYMKVLADAGENDSKLILVGINKAGDRLVQFGSDVGLRIDVFKLEQNPPELVERLISLGEEAMNIGIEDRAHIVASSQGSFQIAQLLCHSICIQSEITESQATHVSISPKMERVLDEVLNTLRRIFHGPCVEFAQGSKLRPEGRAPYLHILRWLVDSEDWSIDLRRALRDNPDHRGSVGQVVTKGYLEALINDPSKNLSEIFHYQPETNIFTVEDPKLVFYLRNINWKNFTKEIGFSTSYFPGKYDIALSFAGADRECAKKIFDALTSREVSVFYDEEEQHRILANNIEDYLAPIYRSEASYVVALLSPDYPTRIWTKFESDQFKSRFGQNSIISVRFRTCQDGFYSEVMQYGALSFDPANDIDDEVSQIVTVICKRLAEDRVNSGEAPKKAPD